MAMQRPGRGSTRLGQPAVKAPTRGIPAPAGRPAPAAPPRQAPPATRAGRSVTTRSVPTAGGRSATRAAAPKSNTMLLAGIGGGAVLVLALAYFALGGKSENHAAAPLKESSKPKPVDVAGLEREGMNKCNEGLALVQKNQSQLGSHDLSAGQKQSLIADLEKGKKLIADGMGLLTQANEKSKNTYETKQYQEALITVRKKLMELRE